MKIEKGEKQLKGVLAQDQGPEIRLPYIKNFI